MPSKWQWQAVLPPNPDSSSRFRGKWQMPPQHLDLAELAGHLRTTSSSLALQWHGEKAREQHDGHIMLIMAYKYGHAHSNAQRENRVSNG